MKKYTLATLIASCLFLLAFHNGAYEEAMSSNIDEMNKARTQAALVVIANKFARIGAAEKDQWLPYYYAAYCHIMMTTNEEDITKWDSYLDTAEASIRIAEKLAGGTVELLALKGFANMMRINVDPAARGQEYSMKSVGYLQQASQLDDQNPRVMLMLAQMQYGTAQFFGSGTEEACKMFANSLNLFDLEAREGRGILPAWGRPNAISMLNNCRG
jgi:hypothetical protein